jgi:hypothetical protein
MNYIFKPVLLFLLLLIAVTGCAQQQEPDNEYNPEINTPLFESGAGPLLVIDEGHFNFHTLGEKFAPFGNIAKRYGFNVRSASGRIDGNYLKDVKILVIANALNEKNRNSWQKPVHSAFTPQEIEHLRNWVLNGGRLFLIADHMPFAGAAADLAKQLGFTLYDGFAYSKPNQKFDVFSYANGMLTENKLSNKQAQIDSIISFTGHAFKFPDSAISVITFSSEYKVLMPEVAWEFSKDMEMIPAGGLSQLAYMQFGSGRIVLAGEAAMFTAQKVGDVKIGLNAPFAKSNLPLLLNILRWLSE